MKIAYTVCSLNRLGQVLALSKSLGHHNPDYKFVVGLADELAGRIAAEQYAFIEFINLSDLEDAAIGQMVTQYNIFELSCALKPFFGTYLMRKYQPKVLLYFDTDICIYHSFAAIEEKLLGNSILLTPHYVSPIPDDGKYPMERDVLNGGLYNGGFIGFGNTQTANECLEWWKQRLITQGYNNVCEGMMVDQLWLNLIPLYFREVYILEHPGCNLAYWNLHERSLTQSGNNYFANKEALIFFHFSGYTLDQPGRLSKHQNRYNLSQQTALYNLVGSYQKSLTENRYNEFLRIECLYGKQHLEKHHPIVKLWLIKALAALGYKLEKFRKIN
jgi:hypothetical protein